MNRFICFFCLLQGRSIALRAGTCPNKMDATGIANQYERVHSKGSTRVILDDFEAHTLSCFYRSGQTVFPEASTRYVTHHTLAERRRKQVAYVVEENMKSDRETAKAARK